MAVLFLCAAAETALAQPANDNFADAIVLNGTSGKITGTNVDATTESGEPYAYKSVCSVWYSWTAPESDIFYFDTLGSSSDAVLTVFTGSAVDSLTKISDGIFYARTGILYHIAVDRQEPGDIVMNRNKVIPRTEGTFEMELSGWAFIEGEKIESSDYVIFAFGPGGVSDCRGSGRFIRIRGEWYYVLTIVSDIDGEEIGFKIADSGAGKLYDISSSIIFEAGTSANKDLDKALKADSVYPALGETGKSLNVTVSGFGFDENTKVLMYPDMGNSKSIIGTVDTQEDALGVAVSGTTAYVADGSGGLQIIDISDPTSLSSADTPGDALGVAVSGTFAYVADRDSGLQIIAVSDPKKPEIIGSVDTPGYAYDVAVSGATAYVADDESGLQIIDVSVPANPKIIGSVDTPGYALGVAVSGTFAYIADGYIGGLQIIAVSDPKKPEIIGSVDIPGSAYDVAVSGTTAYVTDYENGLQIIDISDPANPEFYYSYMGYDMYARSSAVAVSGAFAYVTDYENGLQIIAVSDPKKPEIIGSVDIPGSAYDVAVSGAFAYVADGYGLQIIAVSDPKNPQIIGSVRTPGAQGVAVSGTTLYVAAGDLYVIPVIEIGSDSVTVNSETALSVRLPGPQRPGDYSLSLFNKDKRAEIRGVVTFADAAGFQEQERKKALIVAGRASASDTLWNATQMCTKYAYLALLTQGCTRERVYFLSPDNTDIDGDGNLNDIDGTALKKNLENAITGWAATDTDELLIYMTDHGGNGTFYLNENEMLKAEDLDGWLDKLQTETSARVILIYDACMSGSFIPLVTPPAGKERIVMTSSAPDKYAWFNNSGILSFSYQFWSSVFLNAKLYDSFVAAKDIMKSEQTAYLDGDGDGVGYLPADKDIPKADKLAAKKIIIGRGRIAAAAPPVIGNISEEQTLDGETSAEIQVWNITSLNKIKRVWAVVTPPDISYGPGDPVTDLPTAEFISGSSGYWEGIYEDFAEGGFYKITVFAEDESGAYSVPAQTTVIQSRRSPGPKGDISGDSRLSLKDSVLAFKIVSGTDGLIWYDYAAAGVDVNGDKRVGIHEAVYILREIAE